MYASLAPSLALHINPSYCRPATLVCLSGPPRGSTPETRIDVAPDICRAWPILPRPANKPICRPLIAHCDCDARLNPALSPAAVYLAYAAETISVAFTHSERSSQQSSTFFFSLSPPCCLPGDLLRIGADPNAPRRLSPRLSPAALPLPGFAVSSRLCSTSQ